jgi:(4S)-4-hydroxy-5-phosphonooxypentane-2,3-dione isomerase
MYVVTVLFTLKPRHADAFRAAIVENAQASLGQEAGCHRFDVAFSADGRECFLYELYTDRRAFEEHLRSPHFHSFDSRSSEMIESKRVEKYQLVVAAVGGAPA